ncbi:TraM recognition domain-containing protein [Terasakiella sp. SH-1]|uniref:type IV secretory system conjugative DNA transfer family protein n=1 Tax=Terasakiella sp. SH-1 TaxID=2560057 RepID=UPI001074754C|nr:TraM recognition domain-containing protein [Terasakiella sp. SH-1]
MGFRLFDYFYRRIIHKTNIFARSLRANPTGHVEFLAGTESGKSQGMGLGLDVDLLRAQEGKGGFGIVDPHGDLFNTLARLRDFAPADVFDHTGRWLLQSLGFPVPKHADLSKHLTLFDVEDPLHLPGCNPFDIGLEELAKKDAHIALGAVNSSLSLTAYIFSEGQALTTLQKNIFTYVARVIQMVPERNIFTFLDCLASPNPMEDRRFQGAIAAIDDPAVKRFFAEEYLSRSAIERRAEIRNRVSTLLSNPVFLRMFMSQKNTIDFGKIMNNGGILLANTSKSVLHDASGAVSRYFVASVLQAAYRRGAMAPEHRLPWRLFVDEVQNARGQKLEELLSEARKYGISICMAHQHLDQLKTRDGAEMKTSVASNVKIKMVGRSGLELAEGVSKLVGVKPEQMKDLRITPRLKADFYCYTSGVMHQGKKISIPLGYLNNRPKMSPKQFEKIRTEQRERYAAKIDGFSLLADPKGEKRKKAQPVTDFSGLIGEGD